MYLYFIEKKYKITTCASANAIGGTIDPWKLNW